MTVLIAYDGSDDAQAAVEYAARRLRAGPTVIMTVWEPLLTQISLAPPAAAVPVAAEPEPGERFGLTPGRRYGRPAARSNAS